MNKFISSAAACVGALVVGCASYPAPTDHLANSYANIRAAQAVGATTTPQASLHLRLAEEEQAKAKGLVSDSKNEEADYMTMRANADAELAMAIARESAARGQATVASAQVGAVKQEARIMAAGQPPLSATATTTTTSTTVPTPANAK